MQIAPRGRLHLRVAASYQDMSREAAEVICRQLAKRPGLLLCASAGETPTRAYELLAGRGATKPALFKYMRVLQIDEWGGLSSDSAATCAVDLKRKLLKPLGIPAKRFKGFNSSATNPGAECERVRRWLQANGPIDVCILGLGKNGHIAMNEPAKSLIPHSHVTELTESSRRHGMLRGLARKPRYGMTLGIADILHSRKILLLVSGHSKRGALKRLMSSGISTGFPASLLWTHPDATVLCDRDAAGDLGWRS